MACSERCRRSVSPKASCRCSCGGANHGVEVSNPPVSAAAGPSGGSGGAAGRDTGTPPPSAGSLSGFEPGSTEARVAFGTREGSGGGDYSQADLVVMRAASEGRPFTAEEERFVREAVADAGFDSGGLEKVGRGLAGLDYRGAILVQGEEIPTLDRHDATHVVLQREWPEGTTKPRYASSLRDVVLDPATRILYSRRGVRKHLGFVRRSGDLEGPGGREWVWVEYRLETGHWMTGFQRSHTPEEIASEPRREDARWMNAQD